MTKESIKKHFKTLKEIDEEINVIKCMLRATIDGDVTEEDLKMLENELKLFESVKAEMI